MPQIFPGVKSSGSKPIERTTSVQRRTGANPGVNTVAFPNRALERVTSSAFFEFIDPRLAGAQTVACI